MTFTSGRCDGSRSPKRRTSSGFTLLEVLAAVAILGIWFTVLAGVAIQGLRAEGENARLIRASLAADATLVEVEAEIATGLFPLEEQEIDGDEFLILVRPIPFLDAEFESSESDLSAFLAEQIATVNSDLYEIAIEVTWVEGVDERKLVRTTYAWDSTAYLEAITTAAGEDGADGQEGETGEDGENGVSDRRAERAKRGDGAGAARGERPGSAGSAERGARGEQRRRAARGQNEGQGGRP